MILVVRIWVIQRRLYVCPRDLLEVGLVVEEGHQGQGGLAQARTCLRRFVHTGVSGGNYDYINPALKGRLCRAFGVDLRLGRTLPDNAGSGFPITILSKSERDGYQL